MIINSMKSCALGLVVDGSDDDNISCFHQDKETSDGRKKVRKSNEVVIYLKTK